MFYPFRFTPAAFDSAALSPCLNQTRLPDAPLPLVSGESRTEEILNYRKALMSKIHRPQRDHGQGGFSYGIDLAMYLNLYHGVIMIRHALGIANAGDRACCR
jgi:hypothetical protein